MRIQTDATFIITVIVQFVQHGLCSRLGVDFDPKNGDMGKRFLAHYRSRLLASPPLFAWTAE
jgi:hypothetical protein